MENASKALIIAATVLISVLIVAIAVYLFATYSQFAYENEQRQIQQEQAQYNAKFEKYEDKDLNIYDVISIVNLAIDINKKIEGSNMKQVQVMIGGVGGDWAEHLSKNPDLYVEWIYYYSNLKYRIVEISDKDGDNLADYIKIKCLG